MADDLLTRISREIDERMDELRPQIAEIATLEAAREALSLATADGRSPTATARRRARVSSATDGRKQVRAPAHRGPTRSSATRAGKPAPRGANRQAILAVIGERPDVSSAEIAKMTGIAKPTLYNTLRALMRQGTIEKREVGGVAGYHLK